MRAFIVGIEQDNLLVERSFGKPWAYRVREWEEAYGILPLLRERQKEGWPELAIGTFEPIGKDKKPLKLVGLGL